MTKCNECGYESDCLATFFLDGPGRVICANCDATLGGPRRECLDPMFDSEAYYKEFPQYDRLHPDILAMRELIEDQSMAHHLKKQGKLQ